MGTFLQVIGAVALIAIILVVGTVIYVVHKVKKGFRELKKELQTHATPEQIHLVMAEDADDFYWKDEQTVTTMAEPLPGLGFTHLGDFAIPELPHVHLKAFYNSSQSAFAVLYEFLHKDKPLHSYDIVSRYEDGEAVKAVTYSSSAMSGLMDKPEGFISVKMAGASAENLFKAFLERRPQGRLLAVSPDVFVERFEQAYAHEMEWRKNKGGTSKEEIARVAAATNKTVSDEQIDLAQHILKERGE